MTQNIQDQLYKEGVVEHEITAILGASEYKFMHGTEEKNKTVVELKMPWSTFDARKHVKALKTYQVGDKVKCKWKRGEFKSGVTKDGDPRSPKKLAYYEFNLLEFDTALPVDISNNEHKNYSDIFLPDEYISDLKQPTQPVQQSPSAPVVDEWDQQPPSIDQLPPEMPSAEVPAEPPAEVPAEPIFYPYGENWTLSKSDWGVRWGWASHVAIAKMQLNPIAYGIHEATAEEIDAIFLNQTENVFDNHLPEYIKQNLPTHAPKRAIDAFE
jgi:hypothetical protein